MIGRAGRTGRDPTGAHPQARMNADRTGATPVHRDGRERIAARPAGPAPAVPPGAPRRSRTWPGARWRRAPSPGESSRSRANTAVAVCGFRSGPGAKALGDHAPDSVIVHRDRVRHAAQAGGVREEPEHPLHVAWRSHVHGVGQGGDRAPGFPPARDKIVREGAVGVGGEDEPPHRKPHGPGPEGGGDVPGVPAGHDEPGQSPPRAPILQRSECVVRGLGEQRAMLMLLAVVSRRARRQAGSAKASFSTRWQSSKVPATAKARTFRPRR